VPDAQHLLLFILAGWLLNLTPGPDVLYIATSSLRSGLRAGIVAAFGITAGCFVHMFAAAAGVGALIAASATAFSVLKWAGAAYLLWTGAKLLFSKAAGFSIQQIQRDDAPGSRPASLQAVFRGAFLTNVLNPKVALFFLAFVPQFIAPGSSHEALDFVLLGALFNFNSIPVNIGWALAAAWMAKRSAVQRGMHWLDRAAGAMFIAFGLRLAFAEAPHSAK
jgi:threonine/homoserine/homoserine lactone efflux protein